MLWFARSHPKTPLLAKVLGVATVAYALSPIDLIPDFIPVLGFLDEVIILPAMIWLVVRLLPQDVIDESRARADTWMAEQHEKPVSYAGAAVIVLIWGAVLYFAWKWLGTD